MNKYVPVLVMCIALLCGCAKTEKRISDDSEAVATVFAMDTEMTLKAYGENAEEAICEARSEINRMDSALRRGNSDSEIYKINTGGSAEVSEDTAAVICRALDICKSTGGAFDISIAPVMDIWGFYTKEFNVPTEEELAAALCRVDYKKIKTDGATVSVTGGAQIDLGGIAKGYLSSRIAEIFDKHNVKSGIISLGGNVYAIGKKTNGSDWRVAIQAPDDKNAFAGTVSISDAAVVTSGGYQRYFERDGEVYHHIIDPSDGKPAHSGVKSVSIVSKDGTLADGLSTALFVMGMDNGYRYWKEHRGFDVIFITDDDEIYITAGLSNNFQSERQYTVLD